MRANCWSFLTAYAASLLTSKKIRSDVALRRFSEDQEGDEAKRTNSYQGVPVGNAMIGRVVDALGNPIDEAGEIIRIYFRSKHAQGISDRQPVKEPLQQV